MHQLAKAGASSHILQAAAPPHTVTIWRVTLSQVAAVETLQPTVLAGP